MSRAEKLALKCLATYVVIGFLIFGKQYNIRTEMICTKDDWDCEFQQRHPGAESALIGIAWPFWITAKAAIWVTRWP